LVTIESVGRTLDPHFDIAGELRPFLHNLTRQRFHLRRILINSIRTAEDLQRIAMLLPQVLGQSLEPIRRAELTVHFDLEHFANLVKQLARASNILTAGIVVAGLLVSSAMILRVGPVSLAYGGFGMAVILCLWLLWAMWRG